MRRIHLALLTVLACLLAAAIGLIAARAGGDGARGGTATTADGVVAPDQEWAGALRPPGIPTPDFALPDQDGERVTLSGERGQVVVLTFLYSTCEDTCPITAQQIRGAFDILGHDVPALAVSVDPADDTPDRAQRFLLEQKMTGRMRFLLGDRAQLEPIWKAYGIRPQGDGFEHSAHVVLIDRDGRQRIGFPVSQLTPEGLAHDIRKLEAEGA
ncbi:MAG TPA: SCO family protein [Capillimicrobium sp.]|nr:SCO family protein [Capillimicrobium sp.]